ncbi:hypothetical protein IFM89_039271 [Coptis chinensis]|uniref:Uncharacterized protein n=1 Tax=Coptis chinensis TaxID=261450 RepID=A0A835M370_9MAGN|nr:hypothetical protein IFM89_039271 [Coptis chinensis]
MQTGKSAMASAKETASNIAASAKSGMDKTKATVQEKVDKMSANDPIEKDMATQRKQDKITQAEINKQETREHNATARQQVGGVTGGTTTGGAHSTGMHQMSSLPGHGAGQPAGQPAGQVVEGTVQSHPIGVNAGTGRTAAQNPRAGGDTNLGYGTGGSYT